MHALGAEELERADFAELAPVVAVGGGGDAGAVVGDDLGDDGGGAGGEVEVVGFGDLLCGVGGGDHDDGELAEFEVHRWAEFAGEDVEGAVRDGAEEVVDVSDEGELPWAGWDVDISSF